MKKILLCTLLVLPSCAGAATYEVAPGGDDSNPGTAEKPWRTLQKAGNSVKAGDTVLVNDGSYAAFYIRDKIGAAANRIVFQSKTKWGAKVTGSTQYLDGISVLSSCFVTLDGFEVSGSGRAGISARSFTAQGDGADTQGDIVQNCFCHDNGLPSGGAHDGIFTGFALNFTAQDNICDHNGEHGIYISNSADNPIARGNRCSNNRAAGIQLNADKNTGNGDQDGLISNWLVENNVIFGNGAAGGAGVNLDGDIFGICRNNLIYNNLASGIAAYGIDGASASHDNLFVNNTIYDPNSTRAALLVTTGANNVAFNNIFISKTGIEVDGAPSFQHDYNLVSSYDSLTPSAHESAAPPTDIFVGATDFHLKPGSPAIDGGVANFAGKNAPGSDLELKTRPAGANFDIGCYESGAAQTYNLRGRVVRWVTLDGATTKRGVADAQIVDPQNAPLATTDADGRFAISNLSAGSYALSAQKVGFVFDPTSQTLVLPSQNQPDSPDGFARFASYQIVGALRRTNGSPIAGAAIVLSGAATQNTITGSDGGWSFKGLGAGNYAVAPQPQNGFVFSPANKQLTLPTASKPGLSPNGRATFTRQPAPGTAKSHSSG